MQHITYLGHAGFAVEEENHLLIMDPWMTPFGAHGQGWFQWPPNHHLRGVLAKRVGEAVSVIFYISHEHRDHYDPETLELLLKAAKPGAVRFVIADFEVNVFEHEIRELAVRHGATVTVLGDGEVTQVGPFKLTLYVDDMGVNHDSAIFVESPRGAFFSQNDCKIFDRLGAIKAAHPPIDYYAVQFSGANWFPSTFEMEEETKQTLAHAKKVQKFRNVGDAIELLKPKAYIANAGPVVFLDPREDYINRNSYNFPMPDQLFEWLGRALEHKAALLAPEPGEVNDIWNSDVLLPTDDRITAYRAECYTGRPQLHCTLAQVEAHLTEKNFLIKPYAAELNNEPPLIFRFESTMLAVHLGNTVEPITTLPERYELIDAPNWWYAAMVQGWSGQDLSLTMAPRLTRVGQNYSTAQSLFLMSNLADIAANFRQRYQLKQERITREVNGVTWEFDRFCPHQGGDLANCPVKQGKILCPRHSIVFDLNRGGVAVNAEGLTLNAQRR